MRKRSAGLIITVTVVGIVLSCGRRGDPDGFLRREMVDLQRRTVPPGSEALVCHDPVQDGASKTVRWEFDTKWNWAKYRQWVRAELRVDFGSPRVGESRLVFDRFLEGDAEEVHVDANSNGGELNVQVTFVVYPD